MLAVWTSSNTTPCYLTAGNPDDPGISLYVHVVHMKCSKIDQVHMGKNMYSGRRGDGLRPVAALMVYWEVTGAVTLNLDPRKIRSPRNKYFRFVVKYSDLPRKKSSACLLCVPAATVCHSFTIILEMVVDDDHKKAGESSEVLLTKVYRSK